MVVLLVLSPEMKVSKYPTGILKLNSAYSQGASHGLGLTYPHQLFQTQGKLIARILT